jgi:hypothetical protein
VDFIESFLLKARSMLKRKKEGFFSRKTFSGECVLRVFSYSKWVMLFAVLFGFLSTLVVTGAKTHADDQRSTYTYQITIHTCDIGGAGTDGDVYVQLLADQWNSQWALLDKSWYNDFERNDRDTYTMKVATEKPLSQRSDPRVKVWHGGAEWCMDNLKVKELETGSSWFASPVRAQGVWFGNRDCRGVQSDIICQRERTWHLIGGTPAQSELLTPTATLSVGASPPTI